MSEPIQILILINLAFLLMVNIASYTLAKHTLGRNLRIAEESEKRAYKNAIHWENSCRTLEKENDRLKKLVAELDKIIVSEIENFEFVFQAGRYVLKKKEAPAAEVKA
jgi:hypothetical protein